MTSRDGDTKKGVWENGKRVMSMRQESEMGTI